MTIPCSNLDDLLLDGTPQSMQLAAQHAAGCPACAETLESWNDISATAGSMRTTWTSDLLWPRIERRLVEDRRSRLSGQARLPVLHSVRRVAAAMLLTVGLGGTMWYALREQAHEAAFDRRIIQSSALDEVEKAENAHVAAIAKLEGLAETRLEETETPLMVSYKEKLMLLDDAIAECEAAVDRNRQNAHLRKQLLAMYSDKQQTLEDVLREDTHVSTP
ncbi:MAG TPA: hypothetical protein VNA69_03660 [Thermoanaerobaculia bacterium]|nr:hypothetical protein [Thermoanaerobaculia bacterium]